MESPHDTCAPAPGGSGPCSLSHTRPPPACGRHVQSCDLEDGESGGPGSPDLVGGSWAGARPELLMEAPGPQGLRQLLPTSALQGARRAKLLDNLLPGKQGPGGTV